MSAIKLAIIAACAIAGFALCAALIWFTAWDMSPSTWEPGNRFMAGFLCLISGAMGALAGAQLAQEIRG